MCQADKLLVVPVRKGIDFTLVQSVKSMIANKKL